MESLSKKQIIIIGIIIIVIAIVIIYYFFNNLQQINYDYLDDTEQIQEDNQEENITKKEEALIVVHIAGAVQKEGIVKLEEGTRIIDAIEAAGGLKEEADLTNINLAYVISDGQKIYIPNINEENNNLKNGEGLVNTTGGNQEENTLININTTTVTELLELPGIGSSTAQKIVDYRKENGKFNTIEEIKNVSGIGDAKYNNIKDYICVK